MPGQFLIKRGEKINGPFSVEKLQSLQKAKKLKADDEISQSRKGPWNRLGAVYKSILKEDRVDDSEDDDDGYEDDYGVVVHQVKRSSQHKKQSSGTLPLIIVGCFLGVGLVGAGVYGVIAMVGGSGGAGAGAGGGGKAFQEEQHKLAAAIEIGITKDDLRKALQRLNAASSGRGRETEILDAYKESLEVWTFEEMSIEGHQEFKKEHVALNGSGRYYIGIKDGVVDLVNVSRYTPKDRVIWVTEHNKWKRKLFALLTKHKDAYIVEQSDVYDEEWVIKGDSLTQYLLAKAAGM